MMAGEDAEKRLTEFSIGRDTQEPLRGQGELIIQVQFGEGAACEGIRR